MQLNNDEFSRGKGERESKEEGRGVSYQRIWKTNFTMAAKTQKERVESGGGQKSSTARDESLLGK